jgi:hypothetical protein
VRERAATLALNWSGKHYGWRQALRMTLIHLPLARRAGEWYHGRAYDPTDMTPSGFDEPKVCSTLVAWAYRRAIVELGTAVDWDPVPGRGDNWIEPAHLVQSGSFRRVFRAIVPDGYGFSDELSNKERPCGA